MLNILSIIQNAKFRRCLLNNYTQLVYRSDKTRLIIPNWVALSDKHQTLFVFKYRIFISKNIKETLIIAIHRIPFVIDENGIIDEVITGFSKIKTPRKNIFLGVFYIKSID
jgi:hypothetical protein